jgi:hypothetical protein
VTVKDAKFTELEPTVFNDDELAAFFKECNPFRFAVFKCYLMPVCARLNLRTSNGMTRTFRRGKIGSARLGQGEKPLYVVVNDFQLVVCPLLNFVEVAAAMIRLGAVVKPDDDLSVRHGTASHSHTTRKDDPEPVRDAPRAKVNVGTPLTESLREHNAAALWAVFARSALPHARV